MRSDLSTTCVGKHLGATFGILEETHGNRPASSGVRQRLRTLLSSVTCRKTVLSKLHDAWGNTCQVLTANSENWAPHNLPFCYLRNTSFRYRVRSSQKCLPKLLRVPCTCCTRAHRRRKTAVGTDGRPEARRAEDGTSSPSSGAPMYHTCALSNAVSTTVWKPHSHVWLVSKREPDLVADPLGMLTRYANLKGCPPCLVQAANA